MHYNIKNSICLNIYMQNRNLYIKIGIQGAIIFILGEIVAEHSIFKKSGQIFFLVHDSHWFCSRRSYRIFKWDQEWNFVLPLKQFCLHYFSLQVIWNKISFWWWSEWNGPSKKARYVGGNNEEVFEKLLP